MALDWSLLRARECQGTEAAQGLYWSTDLQLVVQQVLALLLQLLHEATIGAPKGGIECYVRPQELVGRACKWHITSEQCKVQGL